MRLTGDRLTAHVGRARIVRTGAAISGTALALALLAEHPAAAFIAFACLGVGIANVFPLVVSAASRTPAPAVAIATVSTGGYAGVLIGPPAIGFLADAISLPAALGLIVALCALMAALGGLVRSESPGI
jgi:MFS family permease